MLKVMKRVKNTYDSDGILEICRKLVFYGIYKFNGKRNRKKVIKSDFEFGLCRDYKREFDVVISLTTHPKRFNYMELCLKSLILQDEKPNHIVVYLGSDANDVELPEKMQQFKKYGVEFKYDRKRNLKSHKKYFYAMQEFSDAVIVTADDDIIYSANWLKSLLQSYRKFPKAISARRVHLMKQTEKGTLKSYNHWTDQYRKCIVPSHSLFATGNAGILYPPKCLDNQVFDYKTFSKLCYEADDVWLKCMAVRKDTKVVWVPNNEVDLPEVEGAMETALSLTNVCENRNDMYIRNVMEVYNIETKSFFG